MRLAFLAAATVGVAIGGCSDPSPAKSGAPLPPSPATVELVLREYSFDYDKNVPAGRVILQVRNAGQTHHSVDLFPLDEDVPPIDTQLRGSERRRVRPFGGVFARPPGDAAAFAVDLVAGQRYALVCFLRDEDGSTHAVKGMNSEFRAGETSRQKQ